MEDNKNKIDELTQDNDNLRQQIAKLKDTNDTELNELKTKLDDQTKLNNDIQIKLNLVMVCLISLPVRLNRLYSSFNFVVGIRIPLKMPSGRKCYVWLSLSNWIALTKAVGWHTRRSFPG